MLLSGGGFLDPLLPGEGGVKVEIDWSKDGTYSTWGDNVTSLVRPNASAVTVAFGRDQSTALSPTVAGSGGFVLDNRDRRFSPRNTASLLYGKIKPARPVRITRQIGSNTYGLFIGHTDDNPINPDLEAQSVSLTLVDSLADFRGQTVSTQLHRDIRTGEAIGLVLDACGWSTTLRDLDIGATIIPWWWEDGTDALDAMEKIVRSEGPPALLTIGGNGEIVFRDRHHRLTRDNSLTSQQTWRATGPLEPVMQKPFSYDEAWKNIVNTGTMSVGVRSVAEISPVWTSDQTITLAAGEQRMITASASDPFRSAQTPVLDTDYTVLSGTVSITLTRRSGASTSLIMTAGPPGAVVTALQLRAEPLTVAYSLQVSSADTDSITDYGPRSFPGDLPWCGPGDAQAVLDLTVATRAQPLPVVTARFNLADPFRAAGLLTKDLSDRVTVIEPETGLSGDFFVESIAHDLTSVYDHGITFGLEAAPTPAALAPPINRLRFDTTGSGFSDGAFGGGLDFSATMFRFDVAAQGFNAGSFAT